MFLIRLQSDPVAAYILKQPVSSAVDLSPRPDANPISRRDGRLRFQFNPTPHWGPGSRAAVKYDRHTYYYSHITMLSFTVKMISKTYFS